MKKTIKYIALLAIGTSLVVSCDPEFENELDSREPASSGSADFSKYVAIGNSLTAGLADNSLYIDGQLAAYPNILAEQMKFAGGGEFTIPLAASNAGGLTVAGQEVLSACSGTNRFPRRSALGIVDGERGLVPFSGTGAPTEATTVLSGPFNNMGVPGAKSFHLLAPGYGNMANLPDNANPFFVRMASSPDTRIIDDALAQNPTFFTLWIGNNDTLDYATSGGVTTADNAACGGDITDATLFTQAVGGTVMALMDNTAAKGVLINLPSVTDIPFFTTVPYNPLPLVAAQVTPLKGLEALHNGAIGIALQSGLITPAEFQSRLLSYEAVPNNSILTKDEALTDLTAFMSMNLPAIAAGAGVTLSPQEAGAIALALGQARQTNENDLVVLTASGQLGIEVNPATGEPMAGTTFFTGINYPADGAVLEPIEQEAIATAQETFNGVIAGLVEANPDRLALFDAKSFLNEVATTGLAADGGVLTSTFATGGTFSLDGVHLTPRANAVIANGLIDVINAKFGSSLTKVEAGRFKTITVE